MREFSTPRAASKAKAKFLFHNILPATPCGSGFCPDPPYPQTRKLLEINTLGEKDEKMFERYHGVQ